MLTRDQPHISVSARNMSTTSVHKWMFAPPDENIPPLLPGPQSACCMSAITDSGVMCSNTTAAPCIIDDAGASCKYLESQSSLSVSFVDKFIGYLSGVPRNFVWFTALRFMRQRTRVPAPNVA